MEGYSVEAILKATGADKFASAFKNATKHVDGLDKSTGKAGMTIGKLAAAVGITAAVAKGFQMVTSSISGAISRYDTLNNFPNVLQMMGFSAEESSKSIDRLSEGIDGLPTTLDSVASTAQRIAIMTGDLDGATETTLALNNAFLASGSSAGDAQRGLEQYVQMLSKGEVDLQSWRSLQETMPVALNKVAEAFGYTGASAQNDLYAALKDGNVTFDQFNSKLIDLSNETGGFADLARESSTGIATSWQNMKTAVVKGTTDVIEGIDEALGGVGSIAGIIDKAKVGVKGFFSFVTSNIPTVVEGFTTLKDSIEPWIPTIQRVATVMAVLLTVITSANSIIGITAGSMRMLSAVFATSPIGALIAGILLLVGAFTYLWQTNEGFKNFFISAWTQIQAIALIVWESIKGFVMPIVAEIVSFVMQIWGTLVQFWQENGQMILQAAQNVWAVIRSVISVAMSAISAVMKVLWPIIKMLVIDTWNAIKNTIQGAINVILGIVKFFSALFTGNWSAMWDAVKQIFSGALQLVWGLINLWFVGKILKVGKSFVGLFKNVFSTMWNFIKSLFSRSVSAVGNVVSTGFNFIRSIITTISNGIRSIFSSTWNGITSTVRGAINSVKGVISTGLNAALKVVVNIGKSFFNAGKNIVTSIAKGITSAVGKVTNAIGSVTSKIRAFLPFSPAKEGALRDIMKIQIPQSIAESIDKGKRVAVQSMASLSDAIKGEMPSFDIGGQVNAINRQATAQMNVNHTNVNDGRMVALLEKIANSNQVIVLDTGELVGGTYREYDRAGGDRMELAERWGE